LQKRDAELAAAGRGIVDQLIKHSPAVLVHGELGIVHKDDGEGRAGASLNNVALIDRRAFGKLPARAIGMADGYRPLKPDNLADRPARIGLRSGSLRDGAGAGELADEIRR